MRVLIQPHPDELLTNVFNLAIGPHKDGDVPDDIDDKIRVKHVDSSCVLSTAVLFAFTFLQDYPDTLIGLDGSDNLRAILYHSMFKANRATMEEMFICIGVDWYVKLLRTNDMERTAEGSPFYKPRPEAFDYARNRDDLYRYYMFQLRD